MTDGLNLAAAGLEANARGFIDADDYCRTKAATIFAIGDVTGKTQLAHYATAQGIVAAENAVGKKPRRHETLVPNVIFTAPEVATVGLSESDAAAQKRAIKTGKFRFSGLGKGLAAGETTGFVKWIADAESERLLGAAAVGPRATELIADRDDGDPRRVHRARARRNDPRPSDVFGSLDGGRPRVARRKHPCSAAPALADGRARRHDRRAAQCSAFAQRGLTVWGGRAQSRVERR